MSSSVVGDHREPAVMTSYGKVPELRIASDGHRRAQDAQSARHFIGLQLCLSTATIHGALVRIWGRGLLSAIDVVASSRCQDDRLGTAIFENETGVDGRDDSPRRAAELAEAAAGAVAPLTYQLNSDNSSLRGIGLLDFGKWSVDAFGDAAFEPRCDTALLAKLSNMTVIDDFPARDLVHRGRGGPTEAVGAWLLLSDRGIMPGRVIRALVDLDQTVRLILMPPRQDIQLPPQLMCFQLGPGLSLLEGIMRRFVPSQSTFEDRENLAVQGRQIPELIDHWRKAIASEPTPWTPDGVNVTPLLDILDQWPESLHTRLADVLCSAVHLISQQIAECVRHHLPQAFPVGQLILGGPIGHHAFLLRQINHHVPEVDVVSLDNQVATTDSWRAVAAALQAVLHVDQVPGNSPALTGADTPRILGRITPGSPANWHRVLTDMATTLRDKMTLRSAI